MKRWMPSLAALAAFVATASLWIANCTGPKPVVSDVRLQEPSGASDPYVVVATIRNDWRGHGEVRITARLRDTNGSRVFEQQTQATLEKDQPVAVAVEIRAPRGSYTPLVEAQYPPA